MIFGIGDLHLSHSVEKPMSIFGEDWFNHQEKIKKNWEAKVSSEDAVLIPGDISWAMTEEEAWEDLLWIENLPGKKYLIRGNHDYWWKRITKMNEAFNTLHFIQNKFFPYRQYAICGARGWILPGSADFNEHDEKIYLREALRLEASLKDAKKSGQNQIVAMMHYPPLNEKKEPSHFTRLMDRYNVKKVVYGHLHGEDSWGSGSIGQFGKTDYRLVSSDYLNFTPAEICPD